MSFLLSPTFSWNESGDTNTTAIEPPPLVTPDGLIIETTPMLFGGMALSGQPACVPRQIPDLGAHLLFQPYRFGLDQSDQCFAPEPPEEIGIFEPDWSVFSPPALSLTDSSISTASPLEAQSPYNDPGPFTTGPPASQAMLPGIGFPPQAILQPDQQRDINSFHATGTSLHQMPLFLGFPNLPAGGGEPHSSYSNMAPAEYHQPTVISNSIQRSQNRGKSANVGRRIARVGRRLERPEKCPFPECEFHAKGQAYRNEVRRHICSKHRKSLHELSDDDKNKFDLINNPPKNYHCEVEGCSHSDATKFKGYGRPDHLTRHMTDRHGRLKKKGTPSAILALQS